jgi:hypothetical protein
MESRTLSENHQRILELVRDLRFTDREQLTALMADKLKENGTEFALRSLVARGYLSKNLRNANSPRATEGISRKRIVYYLAENGRTHFGFTERQRQVFNWKVARAGADMADLAHEVGISWFHTLGLLGHRDKLWDLVFKRGKHLGFGEEHHRHTPDSLAVFSSETGTYRRYVEYVHKAKIALSVRHAVRYYKAFQEEAIEGRVVWITRQYDKMRSLRAAIHEAVPEAGDYFLFVAQENVALDPTQLLKPIFATTDNAALALFPSRKSEKAVALRHASPPTVPQLANDLS